MTNRFMAYDDVLITNKSFNNRPVVVIVLFLLDIRKLRKYEISYETRNMLYNNDLFAETGTTESI